MCTLGGGRTATDLSRPWGWTAVSEAGLLAYRES